MVGLGKSDGPTGGSTHQTTRHNDLTDQFVMFRPFLLEYYLITLSKKAGPPGEEVMDIFKLLRNSQLRLHHVEKQGGGHDGTTVDLEIIVSWKLRSFFERVANHRVVGLSIVVESDLVKSPAARLPPNELLNHLHI